MKTHDEIDRVGGITYIGPRSFALAFAAVCAAFLAIGFGLDRVTGTPDVPAGADATNLVNLVSSTPSAATVATSPAVATAAPVTTAAAMPVAPATAAAKIGGPSPVSALVRSTQRNTPAVTPTVRPVVAGHVAANRGTSTVSVQHAAKKSPELAQHLKVGSVTPLGPAPIAGVRAAAIARVTTQTRFGASARTSIASSGSAVAVSAKTPGAAKPIRVVVTVSSAPNAAGRGARGAHLGAPAKRASTSPTHPANVPLSTTFLVPFASAKLAGSTALAPHSAGNESILIAPQRTKTPSP